LTPESAADTDGSVLSAFHFAAEIDRRLSGGNRIRDFPGRKSCWRTRRPPKTDMRSADAPSCRPTGEGRRWRKSSWATPWARSRPWLRLRSRARWPLSLGDRTGAHAHV